MKSVTTLRKKKKKEDKVPFTTSEISFEVATSNVTFCKMPHYTWYAKIRSTLMKHAEGVSSHHTLHNAKCLCFWECRLLFGKHLFRAWAFF